MKHSVDHKQLFVDFCKKEVGVGGPDPQMKVLAELCKGRSFRSKMMLAGLYAIIYDVSSAEYAWNKLVGGGTKKLTAGEFVNDHWDSMVIRTERRCVRTKSNFLKCLKAYRRWSKKNDLENIRLRGSALYDHMWNEVTSLPFIGRYAAIKLLRAIRDCAGMPLVEYDIRPKDAWSPRAALGLLYPKHADRLNSKSADLEYVHRISTRALRLVDDLGVGYYELQALLCEYKEMLRGNRFYPGRSHDEVLGNLNSRAIHRVSEPTNITQVRSKIFPTECLGEVGDRWRGVRKPLQATWRDHGYVWSDLHYDYEKSSDLSKPKVRK